MVVTGAPRKRLAGNGHGGSNPTLSAIDRPLTRGCRGGCEGRQFLLIGDCLGLALGSALGKIEVPGRADGIGDPVVRIPTPHVRLDGEEQICETD